MIRLNIPSSPIVNSAAYTRNSSQSPPPALESECQCCMIKPSKSSPPAEFQPTFPALSWRPGRSAAPSLASYSSPTAFHFGWCSSKGVGHHAARDHQGCALAHGIRAHRRQMASSLFQRTRPLALQCARHANPPQRLASLACNRGSRVPAVEYGASEPPGSDAP